MSAKEDQTKKREIPSACHDCTGCARKKGCQKIARWKKVQKQEGGVAEANKTRKGTTRRSQSVSTNICRVTPLMISRTQKGQVRQGAKDKEVFKAADQVI